MVRIGVIGCGHMGRNHIRNIADEKNYDFAGIYDNDPNCANAISAEYGIKAYESKDELLNDVEAVVVAVPSSLHKEVGLLAAAHGVHALIEKPLATNSKDAR